MTYPDFPLYATQFKERNLCLKTINFRSYVPRPSEKISSIAQRQLGNIKYIEHILYLSGVDAFSVTSGVTLYIPLDPNEAEKMEIN